MLGLPLEGMDPTYSLCSIDEMPPRFKDQRIVPKIQMVGQATSEPITSYPWDPRNCVVSIASTTISSVSFTAMFKGVTQFG